MSEKTICQASTELDDSWRQVYETAFPANEREPETRIAQLIGAGRMLLHKTTSLTGDLLCFSLVSVAPDFHFLAYIATNPNQRSTGVGSKHMKKLIEELKAANATSIGLFLEIDKTAPRQTTVSDDEKKVRARRLAFYRRLGAKKVCRNFQFLAPSKGGTDTNPVELELLHFNFTAAEISKETRRRVVLEIYQRFYCLEAEDELVAKTLAQFGPCQSCEDDAEASTDQAASASQPKEAGTATESGASAAPAEQVSTPPSTNAPVASESSSGATATQAPAVPDASADKPVESTTAVSAETGGQCTTAAKDKGQPASPAAPGKTTPSTPAKPLSDCEVLAKPGTKPDCNCGGDDQKSDAAAADDKSKEEKS